MQPTSPQIENPLSDEVREVNGVRVVSFQTSKILTDRSVADFGARLMRLIEAAEGPPRILLNFKGLTFLSSAAIGKLIMIHRKVKERGGELRLCHLSPTVLDVFRVARLHDLFSIDADVDTSLASFA